MTDFCSSDNFYISNEKFARTLFTHMNVRSSFVITPFPIYSCSALIFCGATGNTAREMHSDIPLPTADRKEMGKLFRGVFDKYKNNPNVVFAINIFHSFQAELKKEFLALATGSFYIHPIPVKFASHVATARIINDFVANRTENKIENVCQRMDITPNMRIVAVSAFSFMGKWKKPFMRHDTVREQFWVTDKKVIQVEMMTQTDMFNYMYNKDMDANIIELPYIEKDLSLIVILPVTAKLEAVEEKLKKASLCPLIENLVQTPTEVKIPVFSLESGFDLAHELSEIGVGKIFSYDAELDNMIANNREGLGKFFTKTKFQVAEDGTDDARKSARPSMFNPRTFSTETQKFHANHPFIFFLRSSGAIFIMGRYAG